VRYILKRERSGNSFPFSRPLWTDNLLAKRCRAPRTAVPSAREDLPGATDAAAEREVRHADIDQLLFDDGYSLGRLDPANDWRPSLDELDELDELDTLVTERTRAIVVNFPHNPTGASSPRPNSRGCSRSPKG
jgi:hypothetical protein